MRTRRFAQVEKLRAKERRLLEILRRQEAQRVLELFPLGVSPSTEFNYSASIGGSTVSVFAPLELLVHVTPRTFVVDLADTPDPTGGFDDVTIGAGKQIGELRVDQILSMAGKSADTYVVYATHTLADENPESRFPPGKFTEGEGVFVEHAGFYAHGQPLGTAIPRNNYDSALAPETVSEMVDRLVISVAREVTVPVDATRLLRLQWDGAQITSVSDISNVVDLGDIEERVATLEMEHHATGTGLDALDARMTTVEGDIIAIEGDLTDHIGKGGSQHPGATPTVAGFMSVTDKVKLNGIESGAQANPTGAAIFQEVLNRDGVNSGLDADKFDGRESTDFVKGGAINTRLYAGSVLADGTADTLPAGWSCNRVQLGVYDVTFPVGGGFFPYEVAPLLRFPDADETIRVQTRDDIHFQVSITKAGAAADGAWHFTMVTT